MNSDDKGIRLSDRHGPGDVPRGGLNRLVHTLRFKIAFRMLIIASLTGGVLLAIFQPKVENLVIELKSSEVAQHLESLGVGLAPFVIQNQYAAVYEVLESVASRSPTWRQIVLDDNSGNQLYPLEPVDFVQGPGRRIYVHVIKHEAQVLGTLRVSVDISAVHTLIEEQGYEFVLIAFSMFLATMAVIGVMLEAVVLRPMSQLQDAANKVALGDYSTQLPQTSSGEFGNLVDSFSHMRDSVRDNEQSLRKSRLSAENSERAKAEFLATMSHEIRTPMNGVLGLTDLLEQTALDSEQAKLVQIMKSSGEVLLHVVNDILDFSRLEAGRVQIEHIEFDLIDTAEGVIEVMANRTWEKRVQLGYAAPPGLHGAVKGDPSRLRQVLLNLLGNALKFTDEGSVTLEISVPRHDAVRFEVQDTGIGIPQEACGQLFESFFQVDAATSRRFGGTGLGLAICQRLVEAMRGSIGVRSIVGKGSTFWVELPLLEHSDQQTKSIPRPWTGKRALIVEDDSVFGPGLLPMLQWFGLNTTVMTAEEADQLIQANGAQGAATAFDIAFESARTDRPNGRLSNKLRNGPQGERTPVVLGNLTPRDTADVPQSAQARPLRICVPVLRPHLQLLFSDLWNRTESTLEAGVREADETPDSTAPTSRSLKILVAEDNSVNQLVARAMLAQLRHEVTMVHNGVQAVDAVASGLFDVVLMDVQMPEMDGLDATRAIRQLPCAARSVPIIALTANAMKEDEAQCMAAGMDGFLCKPLNLKSLSDALKNHTAS